MIETIKFHDRQVRFGEIERIGGAGKNSCWATLYMRNGDKITIGDGSYFMDGRHVKHSLGSLVLLGEVWNNPESHPCFVDCTKDDRWWYSSRGRRNGTIGLHSVALGVKRSQNEIR